MATNKGVSTELSDLKDGKAPVTSQAVGATFVLSAHEQHVRDEYAKFSPEEARAIEKKLKLKLDLRLFPTLMIMYILNYIDRNALPIAKLAGIQQELGLSSTKYSTCLSILFVGYLLTQVPSNLFLSQVPPSIYLPSAMAVWGVVSGCTALAHSYGGLVDVRFILGFCEAPFFPGAVYLCSSWYKSNELSLRVALLFGGSMLSGSFGSLMAIGITERMDNVANISAWRWLFIIEGALTVAVAGICYFTLPNYPHNTRWLSEKESIVAQHRLLEGPGNSSDKTSMGTGFKLMMKDPKVGILTLNHLLITICASFTNFFPTIMATLGFQRKITYALLSVPYLTGFCIVLLTCWYADRIKKRTWPIVINLAVCIVGLAIMGGTLAVPVRIIASILMISGITSASNMNLAWIGSSIPAPAPKRAASIACVNMGGAAILAIGGVVFFWWYLKKQNEKLASGEEDAHKAVGISDRDFRYVI
ncbi:unnamed protein product [Clonostachys rhizophaga]|uniref:Major facilitator superfamily (MFS) profile domain-containing protein n=1 Tax=Clonostachys rhizophaga TaxID=160324 RepID=A0A9N9VK84_9HYPO|nr:unnamed protein product [Clonostachys rhizophaga]